MDGLTILPLHGGKAPRWLFSRMVKLSGLISEAIIDGYGEREFLSRLSNPYWFQALACAIGYDWHSSGTTTVTMGALKEALNRNSNIFITGGKGKEGTSTPSQIKDGLDYLNLHGVEDEFIDYSRLSAKTDAALVYDNLSIYHHTFVFSKDETWSVVQQGMNASSDKAVRFQIFSEHVDKKSFTNEPNNAVSSDVHQSTLDLTDSANRGVKEASVVLINEQLDNLLDFNKGAYVLPTRHYIEKTDLSKRAGELLQYASDMQPRNYEELLRIKGIGRKTLRSLAIIASLIYEKEISERDPVLYSYNLGGKDGVPFPVDRNTYDETVIAMQEIVKNARIEKDEEARALRRLSREMANAYYNK
jgi:hypothetical protein